MNILLVASPVVSLRRPFKGGTESFITRLANKLISLGHSVDVLALEADEIDSFQTIFLDESPFSLKDAIHSEEWGQKMFKAMQFALMDLERYDLIHFNSYLPLLYDIASLRDIPTVVTLHTPLDDRFGLLHSLHSKRSPKTRYVAVSERLKLDWEQHIASSIAVIANGIDHSWRLPESGRIRKGLVWVGRICEEKNPLDAIELATRTNESLVLLGPADDRDYFERVVKPKLEGNISYGGHVGCAELQQHLNSAKCFIASARWQEPFGLSILESLSAGTTVVGYSSAVPPELRHKECVVLAKEQSVSSLHEAYNTIAQRWSADERIFDKATAHAENFSLQDTAQSYIQVYEDTIRANLNEQHLDHTNILRPPSWQRPQAKVPAPR